MSQTQNSPKTDGGEVSQEPIQVFSGGLSYFQSRPSDSQTLKSLRAAGLLFSCLPAWIPVVRLLINSKLITHLPKTLFDSVYNTCLSLIYDG